MGMFSNLMGKIFGHATPATATTTASATPASAPPTPTSSAPTAGDMPPASPEPAPTPTTALDTTATAAAPQSVDVSAVLDGLAAKNSEHLDWKKSIVDLLKLVGMDSSLSARQELAADLHYSGDDSDSATMNVWLHKEVLRKLAENGGKVPADLLS